MPKYKFYATLLDAFTWYLKSEQENAFQQFIDKLNRVPFYSEKAEKGTAFNELVDKVAHEGELYVADAKGMVHYKTFSFNQHVVDHFVSLCRFAEPQVFVKAILPTRLGDVELYGYTDEVLAGGLTIDIKCTDKYDFPKFLHNWQHIVYPYCFKMNGMDMPYFTYEVTDYKYVYHEDYKYNHERDVAKLKLHVEHLIEFIEQHRHLITDLKLFALDEPVIPKEEKPFERLVSWANQQHGVSDNDIDKEFQDFKDKKIKDQKGLMG